MKKVILLLVVLFSLINVFRIDTKAAVAIPSFITVDEGVKNTKAAEYVAEVISTLPEGFLTYFNGSIIITDDISKYDKYSASTTQGLFLDGNVYIKERTDKDYYHVVSHELSHNLDYQLGIEKEYNYYMSGRDELWLDLFNNIEYVNQEQGTYANVNHGEFFAEVFSDYLTNPGYVSSNFPALYAACDMITNNYF